VSFTTMQYMSEKSPDGHRGFFIRSRDFVVATGIFVVDVIFCLVALTRGRDQLSFWQDCAMLSSLVCLALLWRRSVRQHEILSALLQQADELTDTRSSLKTGLLEAASLIDGSLGLACMSVNCILTVLIVVLGRISPTLRIGLLALFCVLIALTAWQRFGRVVH
jgi:hypothetical protein